MKAKVLQFPKPVKSHEPQFREVPARTNRTRHMTPEEGRARLLAGTLPPWSVIHGSVYFSEGERPIFPPNVRICGSLTLHNCFEVTKLADGLRIDGNADFTGTPLKRLPRKLNIKGYLDLTGTDLKGWPRDLVVKDGVAVDEFASLSLRTLAQKRPLRWMTPAMNS